MASITCCPDAGVLNDFSVGLGGDDLAGELERHLHECPECVARLQALPGTDTLTDAMRAQTVIVERPVVDERVQTLIFRAKQYYPTAKVHAVEEALSILAPPLEEGDLGRLGHYRILKVLGAGGMGIVFEAIDTRLKRPAALKVLRPHLAAFPSARERFRREAHAAAALEHDNLCTIYEVGEDAGLPFLAMQLLAGESLETRLQREKRLTWQEIAAIGRQIAAGLAAAHRRGVVHRDIKPANVFLTQGSLPGGLVKILDFGLARGVAEESHLTQPGMILGTPLYMAPEQADGKTVDARTDLFSLGSVLYAMAAGVPAFESGSTMAVLRAVCDKATRPIRELNPAIPQWLADVVVKLHAKDPAQRYQSADEVMHALDNQSAPAKMPRRFRTAWALAAAALLACVGLSLAEAAGVIHIRSLFSPPPNMNTAIHQVLGAVEELPMPVVFQEEAKPAIVAAALFPIEERGTGVKDLGGKITDLLFAKLAGNDAIFLVDRADLKKTLAEQELNLSGAVRADQATKVGQLTGAKLLITGSVFQVDKQTHIVARIIGTETSRTVGAAVVGKSSEELAPLVEKLAAKLAEVIANQNANLVAKPAATPDRIAALKKQLKAGARPSVWVKVVERHIGAATRDPAAETEVLKFCKETGFEIIDTEEGSKGKADVLIIGEGISETATRTGGLVSVRARVELKAVERKTGRVLAADRQTVLVVDLTEQIAGKAALQEAAAMLAERMLPALLSK